MKRTLFVIMMVFSLALHAQTTTEHVVQKGETIESIAAKYGVTVDELKRINQKAAKFLYAGMKLVIPQRSVVEQTNDVQKDQQISRTVIDSSPTPIPTPTPTQDNRISCIVTHAGWGQATSLGDRYGFNMEVVCGVGYRYYLYKKYFAEGLLEARYYSASFKNSNRKIEEYAVVLPIHVGFETSWARFFTGPKINLPVSAKLKNNGYSSELNKSVFASYEVGVDILSFIKISYALGMSKKSLSSYNIGVTCNF